MSRCLHDECNNHSQIHTVNTHMGVIYKSTQAYLNACSGNRSMSEAVKLKMALYSDMGVWFTA